MAHFSMHINFTCEFFYKKESVKKEHKYHISLTTIATGNMCSTYMKHIMPLAVKLGARNKK